jgi:hypothetical protein
MTRADALKIAARILKVPPARLYWQENPNGARDEHERQEALARRAQLQTELEQEEATRYARVKVLIHADPQWNAHTAKIASLKAAAKTESMIGAHRCELGTTENLAGFRMLHNKANGANWQATIDALRTKHAPVPATD